MLFFSKSGIENDAGENDADMETMTVRELLSAKQRQ